jgi:hypothetical protein
MPLCSTNKFQDGITLWLNNRHSRWEDDIPPHHNVARQMTFEAYLDQMEIGWDQDFHGRVSKNYNKENLAHAKAHERPYYVRTTD